MLTSALRASLALLTVFLILALSAAPLGAEALAPSGGTGIVSDVLGEALSWACPVTQGAVTPDASLPSCIPAKITGSLGSGSADYRSTSGTMSKRLFRDGIPSTCAAPKATPALASATATFRYDAYTFTHFDAPACVTVSIVASATCMIHSVTYLNSFNPADVQANYLGDSGNSSSGATRTYSFMVPTSSRFVVVMHEAYGDSGACPYTLAVSGTTGCPHVWGYVFLDANANGLRDPAERAGLPDIQIALTPDVSGVATTIDKGFYLFPSVPPGDYCASAAIGDGYSGTTPTSLCFSVTKNVQVNFGVQQVKVRRVFLPLLLKR